MNNNKKEQTLNLKKKKEKKKNKLIDIYVFYLHFCLNNKCMCVFFF